MKFIKLHSYTNCKTDSDSTIYVNANSIHFFSRKEYPDMTGTLVSYGNEYSLVMESPEEIMEAIGNQGEEQESKDQRRESNEECFYFPANA